MNFHALNGTDLLMILLVLLVVVAIVTCAAEEREKNKAVIAQLSKPMNYTNLCDGPVVLKVNGASALINPGETKTFYPVEGNFK